MPEYRAYVISDDHIDGPPYVLIADDDETAIGLARKLVKKWDIELWQADRLVIRLSPRAGPA